MNPEARPLKRSLHAARAAAAVLALAAGCGAAILSAAAPAGAKLPWKTYETEAMKTDGEVLGPVGTPYRVETESSGGRCVRLTTAGQHVEFAVQAPANALVLRYSLPDAPDGGGTSTTLGLYVNGRRVRTLELSSHYARLYGKFPFSNNPAEGRPRNFYDELRVKDLSLVPGDVVRLQRDRQDAAYCILDFADLEQAPPPLAAPAGSLSVLDFGASGRGETDDTQALRLCLAEATARHVVAWVPAGVYKITGDILLGSGARLQGAGMWHTTFVGDAALYGQADRRVRFRLSGSGIRVADFAIIGRLDYRRDSEPNDGIVGAGCSDSSVERIWVEHTKTGAWIYQGLRLRIEGCRFRDLLADGVNLCVGTSDTVVEDCSARGTGDDCFAVWPVPSDQGFDSGSVVPGGNVIRRCTGQLPFLANGGCLYGGRANRIEDCAFTDISAGCGILISTTFPTADEKSGADNNFCGTTVVSGCELLRCGGFDHEWDWRAALQICMDRRNLSGLEIRHLIIDDSLSDAISVVGPGSAKGHGTLSNATLEDVVVRGFGKAEPSHHALWIRKDSAGSLRLVGCRLDDIRNDSARFTIDQR